MKWLMRFLVLLMLSIAIYLGAVHFSGGAFPAPAFLNLGGERGHLRQTALSFLEDLQFKDYDKAASYHSPDKQETIDIPFLIQRLFLQKPELLEVMEYEIVFAKIDSSGNRARVKCRVKINDLYRKKIANRDLMLYFQRESAQDPWYMELENSLREMEGEKGKIH